MEENVIYKLSKKFAIRIVKLYSYLCNEKKEYVMSKQLYRCGTSIGANVAESLFAQGDADYLSAQEFDSMTNDVNMIIGITVNIINKKQKQ